MKVLISPAVYDWLRWRPRREARQRPAPALKQWALAERFCCRAESSYDEQTIEGRRLFWPKRSISTRWKRCARSEPLEGDRMNLSQEFKSIKFGFSSAEAESAEDPGLLLDGYLESNSAYSSAMNSSKFLFLGYKGSGKSAIGERLHLISAGDPNLFVRKMDMEDFPFTPFSKMIRGDAEPEAKYPTAWSWIMLIYIMYSFRSDEGMRHPDQQSFIAAVNCFKEMGFAPHHKPAELIKTSSKTSFKLMIPSAFEASTATREVRPASEIPNFVESIKESVRVCRSDSKHFLIIDGLDDILTKRDTQYDSLNALIYETNRLNQDFRKHDVPAKIVLVCRTDLFDRLGGANKNKVRQDYAIELDWYKDTREPEKSDLIKIADKRAERSLGRSVSVFERFLKIRVDDVDLRKSLLDMTRHTPRDFGALLKNIQQHADGDKVTANAIRNGMRTYSISYFLPEIGDELHGYCTKSEFSEITSLLGIVRKRDFTFTEFVEIAKVRGCEMDRSRLKQIFEHLFVCSGVGHVIKRPGGNTIYTFNYRNRHSSFDERQRIILHKGLWKALNLV